jgi:hypothetical protein
MGEQDDTAAGLGLTRRAFLAGAGLAAGAFATGRLPPWFGTSHEVDFRSAAVALWDSLSPFQRAAVCLPWDHPSREVIAHARCWELPRVASLFTPAQRELVRALYVGMTSEPQRRRFGQLVGLEGGGLEPCMLAFFGDPREARCQVAINGGHLLIRGGGAGDTGSAFGGALAYGHQVGNGVPRLPGNAFAHHGDAANALFAELAPEAREAARVDGEPPFETAVQLQRHDGVFIGLAVARLDERRRERVRDLVATVLSAYDAQAQADAFAAIDANGGVEALHLAYWSMHGRYDDGALWSELAPEERARRGDPYWHVWRIEGPGTLLHFRGWDHVHASIHVARDGGAGQHVGEVLATTRALIDGEALRRLLWDALRETSGAEAGFVLEAPVRFTPGPITTGLVWSLDPYLNPLVVAWFRGRALAEPLRRELGGQGIVVEPERSYRIAMPGYFARREIAGEPERVEPTGLRMRAAYEAYFRRHGLSRVDRLAS